MNSLRKVFNLRNAVVFGIGVTVGTVSAKRRACLNSWNFDENFRDRWNGGPGGWSSGCRSRFGSWPSCGGKWNDKWDLPNKCKEEGEKPTATRTIVLVRHGQYNFDNKEDDTEHYLTPLGEEQARLLGQRLKSMGEQVGGFKSVVYSPLQRTTQTAAIACKEFGETNATVDPLLKEGLPCKPEPISPTYPVDTSTAKFAEESRQIENAFRKYFHRADPQQKKDSTEVLVCHANVIRYLVCRALQLPPEAWCRFKLDSVDHTSLTVLQIQPNGHVKLMRYADSTHLPDDKRTFILK